MGLRRIVCPRAAVAGLGILLVCCLTGCQTTSSVSTGRLIAHQAMIDFSGLKSPQTIPFLKVAASIPNHWEATPTQNKLLFVHQQWKSPSRSTGVGVAYIHLPLPMSAKSIIWFAKTQYAQQTSKDGKSQGRLKGEWTDSIGREWFEAENYKYHIRGYAITDGFDAWIVYSGYRLRDPMNLPEIATASRSMDTILPTPLAERLPERAVAIAGR